METSGRKWVTSPLMGGIIGSFAGGLTVLVLESAGHRIFGTVDPTDLASVTTPMWVSVLVAWVVGSWVGGAVATAWSKTTTLVVGTVVGLVLLAGAMSNMFVIPHPVWMMVLAVVLMPGAAILAAKGRIARHRA